MKLKPLVRSLSLTLSASLAYSTAMIVSAAETTEADDEQSNRVTIVGSRIKRVDAEGSTPVVEISAEDISLSGANTVAEALQRSTFNSFGAAGGGANSGWSSQQTVNLRGAGINHTLVLLDGRRMGKSAVLNGGAVNMNAIPASAIEKIEILSAGASAVYGSDAMAGVINVVLKKDYEGLQVSFSKEFDSGEYAGGLSDNISINGGISGEKGNLTFSLEHRERGAVFQRDRDYLQPLTSSNSRNMQDASNNWLLQSYTESPADCQQAYDAPDKGIVAFFNLEGSPICEFEYSKLAGQYSAIKGDSAMFNFNYDVNDSLVFTARSMITQTQTQDVSAPSFGWFEFDSPLPATHYNGIAMNAIEAGDWGNYRLWQNGNRVSDQQDTQADMLFGFDGTTEHFDWNASYLYARSTRNAFGTGFANTSALRTGSWVNDTTHPDFVGLDANGYAVDANGYGLGYVDGWDPRDPNSLPPAASKANFDRKDEYVSEEFSLGITIPIMEMDGGDAQIHTGLTHEDQSFTGLVDGQADAGVTSGGYGSSIGNHDRNVKAFFVEAYFPFSEGIELNVAGRHDDYSDFGTTTNFMASAIWRPSDSLIVRANFGEGFLAPDSRQQYAQRSENWYNINDALSGDASIERKHFDYGNESLKPEESVSWGIGASWDVTENVGISIDYISLQIDNKFYQMNGSDMTRFYAEEEEKPASERREIWDVYDVGNLYRETVATPIDPDYTSRGAIHNPLINFGEDHNEFIDIRVDLHYDDFKANFIWSHMLTNEVESFLGRNDEAGWLGKPEDKINMDLSYQMDEHAINWTSWFTSSQASIFDNHVNSHMEHNITYTYDSPWKVRFAVGVRNITDEKPEFVDDTTSFNGSLYSVLGRRIVFSATIDL
ncbi:TonB-dependent receptor plug domain-containing protein [Aliikangiella sp. IMCC44359]|uniref:TonB-dependent receptor plug domain-containing protein n=1 Tax=Aliikangiella sp. IMCC44359 TaxID=3459125 RepID=UPI00403AA82D